LTEYLLNTAVNVFQIKLPQSVTKLERHHQILFILYQKCAILPNVVKSDMVVYNEVSYPRNVMELFGLASFEIMRANLYS